MTLNENAPGSLDLPEDARCIRCGYSLRALTRAVCPECGTTFDPLNEGTYRRGSAWPKLITWAQPPPLWEVIAAGLFALFAVYVRSFPYGVPYLAFFGMGCCCVPLGGVITMSFVVDFALRCVAMEKYRRYSDFLDPESPRRPRRHWIVFSMAGILTASTVVPWPLLLRFEHARPQLEEAALTHLAGKRAMTGRSFIGTYRIESIYVEAGAVLFVTGHDFDPVGFAYHPGNPQTKGSFSLRPKWYLFYENFY